MSGRARAIALGDFDPDELAGEILTPTSALPATPLQQRAWEIRQTLMALSDGEAVLGALARGASDHEGDRLAFWVLFGSASEFYQTAAEIHAARARQAVAGAETVKANAAATRATIQKKVAAEIDRRKLSGENLDKREVYETVAKQVPGRKGRKCVDPKTVKRAMSKM